MPPGLVFSARLTIAGVLSVPTRELHECLHEFHGYPEFFAVPSMPWRDILLSRGCASTTMHRPEIRHASIGLLDHRVYIMHRGLLLGRRAMRRSGHRMVEPSKFRVQESVPAHHCPQIHWNYHGIHRVGGMLVRGRIHGRASELRALPSRILLPYVQYFVSNTMLTGSILCCW